MARKQNNHLYFCVVDTKTFTLTFAKIILMKKGLLIIGVAIVAVVVYFVIAGNKDEKQPREKQQPLAISANSDVFNAPFGSMLQNYFELKNALVNWDSSKAAIEADSLASKVSEVPYNELKADSNIVLTAKSFADQVAANSKQLAGEKNIAPMRRAFQTLSENLYNLVVTVRYDKEVIYHDKCPMAFGDDEAAYWLATTSDIVNPYFGNKHPKYHSGMINCGSVEDSLTFGRK